MRALGRMLLLLLVLAALGMAAFKLYRVWSEWRTSVAAANADLEERVLFQTLPGRQLRFNAATNQGWLALQGFVLAPPRARQASLPLTIRITLEDASGRTVASETRFLSLQRAVDPRPYGRLRGNPQLAAWILPDQWVDLSNRPRVRSVGVSVLEAAPPIEAVLWRGAITTRLTDAQTRQRYRRLGERARDALTAGWITPAPLIHPDIKRELVRNRTERVAPMGQPRVDFITRRVLRQPSGEQRQDDARPREHAIALSPSMRVSLAPEVARTVLIDATDLADEPLAFSLWRGTGARATRVASAVDGRLRATLEPGLYELRSSEVGKVDVRDAATNEPLLPDGLRRRVFPLRSDAALGYRLVPLAGRVPEVRLALRAGGADARARIRLLDGAGRLLRSRDVPVPWEPSLYDRRSDALDQPVSRRVHVEVQPPADARFLEVVAGSPVLVGAFTALPARYRDAGAAPAQRWFSFLPRLDPRSPSSQGVIVVEQPDTGEHPVVRDVLQERRAKAAAPARIESRPAESPSRPRLRLRPERVDAGPEIEE